MPRHALSGQKQHLLPASGTCLSEIYKVAIWRDSLTCVKVPPGYFLVSQDDLTSGEEARDSSSISQKCFSIYFICLVLIPNSLSFCCFSSAIERFFPPFGNSNFKGRGRPLCLLFLIWYFPFWRSVVFHNLLGSFLAFLGYLLVSRLPAFTRQSFWKEQHTFPGVDCHLLE